LQPEEAERASLPHGGGFELLADASQTEGALGANRTDSRASTHRYRALQVPRQLQPDRHYR
jgi:hypothetical protein